MKAPPKPDPGFAGIGRVVSAAKWRLGRFLKPVLLPIRDRQAPGLHRFMMHQAAVAAECPNGTALVIAPHHDDETFGCGGVIAIKRRAGVTVDVVVLTDGGRSHGDAPDNAMPGLISTRRAEVVAATAVLGMPADRVHFMNLPDQGLRKLDPARRDSAVVELAGLISARRPAEIYVPHRQDHHPDHEAAFAITRDAVTRSGVTPRLFEYPIWLIWKGPARWSMKPDDLAGAIRVDVRPVQEIKNRAIEVYASQLPVLPRGFVDQFTQGCEVFFVDRS